MFFEDENQTVRYSRAETFNMTPIIDIVFLLIIFFLLVCRFIEAENFPVDVPADCAFSRFDSKPGKALTTVTVMKAGGDNVDFAVGPQKISGSDYSHITGQLARLIDNQLQSFPDSQKIVTLRIDKDICFEHSRFALAGVAASSATDIRLAVLKTERKNAHD